MSEVLSIHFYFSRGEHGYLSNFAPYLINLDGRDWPTVEHFYQAQKFTDPDYRKLICDSRAPSRAARLGRARPDLVRVDWADVKESVMHRALRAKFTQHPELAGRLLSTGNARLVEHTKLDSYWADGGNGSGLNRLGVLLEQIREELRGGPASGAAGGVVKAPA